MKHSTALRAIALEQKIKKPSPEVQRNLEHGWLLPTLVEIDRMAWGRWDYWARCQLSIGKLPDDPIPQIEFDVAPHDKSAPTRKMLEAAFDCIPKHGSWVSWSGWEYVRYFLDWLLYGFGHDGQPEPPEEPLGCEGASDRLYQVFMLERMILWPGDYLGDMLSETNYGRHNAFFPTPLHVCEMMTRMTMGEGDHRLERVLDPCVGTGRFPLCASNHSLRIVCCDIDLTMCKCTLVNSYLYAPWIARPIFWIDSEESIQCRNSLELTDAEREAMQQRAKRMSDEATSQAPPHAQGYLFDTEHDSDLQPQVAPILKRRKKNQQTTPDVQASIF